jgi:hypothetical protein
VTRFVFWETPSEILAKAMPLYPDLAALRMQWVLLILARKYNPDQPRVPAGNSDGGQWAYAGGVRVARGTSGTATDAVQPSSSDKTLQLSRVERDTARRILVLQGGGGDFYVAPNPSAVSSQPWYAAPSQSTVGTYNDGIIFASEMEKVDPDLIRTIMYIETTQGYYFGMGPRLDQAGLSKTILPMNINPALWSDLGTRDQLNEPLNNIVAGAKILRGITVNLRYPSVENVATLYNALSATEVSDYGARAGAVYRDRPWLK